MNIKFKKKIPTNKSFYFFEKELKIKQIVDYEFRNITFKTNQSLSNLFRWNKIYSHKPPLHTPVTQFTHC
mgnify:CR=1 FL=1